ncbi:MAG TPA: mechanosensitive ion channel domain-containing protein [Steroidobacteraceae bacterium]|jgi:small-conductance mechanosensitive channel|nr:mechanosensitive ion channel domain-containing protein [Steroidobacteraceae bacterium]
MDSADSANRSVFLQLTSPEILAEVIVIAVAAVSGFVLAHAARRWQKNRTPLPDAEDWQIHALDGAVAVAPMILVVILLLLGRGAFTMLSMATRAIDTVVQLATALVLVRIAVYLLGVLVGPQSWFRRWENRITWGLAVAIGFELVGWFTPTQRLLDSINLLPGKKTFTLWELLKGLVAVVGFVIVSSLVARTLERRVMRLHGLALSTRIGISKFVYFLLVGIGILVGINTVGIDLTALGVLTGAIGLGLGFGLQAIASNFVSGFVLLMDKSIKPGDVISFTGHTGTSTENFGWVQELRGRFVVVRDRDGVDTLVPNQNLITNSVINWSYTDQRVRIRLPVTISYDDDPEKALQALLEATQHHPRILKEPHPVTRLMSFEDHGMRLEVRFWIADPMNGVNNVRSDINRAIWRVFKEQGIKIPVAQREIRLLDRGAEPLLPRPGADVHRDPPG